MAFSNVKVWSADTTTTIDTTATVIAENANPYPPSTGTLALDDPLQVANHWNNQNFDSVGGKCYYIDNTYHVQEFNPNFFTYCNDEIRFDNFAFEVKMTIIQGDCGGVVFRVAGITGNGYFFQVCQSGTDALYTIDSANKR